MSLLPNDTFANPGRALWAVAGSGGGGGGSSLQSPASVIPDGAGDVSLDMNATGAGSSTLTLFPATGAATIILNAQAGADNAIHFSDPASVGIAVYSNDTTPNVLDIGDLSANVVATFDNANNEVRLCDLSVGGTVGCNGNLFVETNVSAGNSLAMFPDTPATSGIFQTIASNGTVGIGSSTTYPETLTVSDVAKNGSATYVEINGTVGATPLFISAAQGVGGACYMYPDSAAGAGSLNLGSDVTNFETLQLTNTAVRVGSLTVPPVYPCSTARVGLAPSGGSNARGQGTYPMTLASLPDGMYTLMVYPVPGSAGSTDLLTLGACFSAQFIVKNNLCVYGGCGTNSTGEVRTFPASGLASITLDINVVGNYYIAVDFFQLSGAVPGV